MAEQRQGEGTHLRSHQVSEAGPVSGRRRRCGPRCRESQEQKHQGAPATQLWEEGSPAFPLRPAALSALCLSPKAANHLSPVVRTLVLKGRLAEAELLEADFPYSSLEPPCPHPRGPVSFLVPILRGLDPKVSLLC